MIRSLTAPRGASLFDERYASTECYYGRSIRPELARFLQATCVSGWEALDLGCGEGRYAIACCFADFDVVKYDEFMEEDRSHGPVHDHGWAVILGRKPERRLVR
jgi:hypothetical protein